MGERETWCTDTQEAVRPKWLRRWGSPKRWRLATWSIHARCGCDCRGSARCTGRRIDYRAFQTIVYRTDLVTDPDLIAAVDTRLAVVIPRWPALTQGRLAADVDRVVARADRDAVRRRRERQAEREFSIWDSTGGLTEVFGRLITTDAHAVDARLDALAATVCADDPRTRNQRRADALGALAAGADRLTCRCGQSRLPGREDRGTERGRHSCHRRTN